MNKKLNIINPATIDRACMLVREAGEGHEVSIKPIPRKRSVNQNDLYWKWNAFIGGYTGETTDEVHQRNKLRHLLPILRREDLQSVNSVEENLRNISDTYRVPENQIAIVRNYLVTKITTTTLSTKLMAEYMEQVEREAVSLGISLPRPEDLAA